MEKDLFVFGGYNTIQLTKILAYIKTEIDFTYNITSVSPSAINKNEYCHWVEIEVKKNNYDDLVKWCTFFSERSNILKQIF